MPTTKGYKALPGARSNEADARPEQPFSGLAYEKLLELILAGELAPGAVLNERKLAIELEMSRTPVREAISRLAAEGLFADERKRPLPFLPRTIGLVCGSDAAAKRDVIETAEERYPPARFRVLAVPVQGAGAVLERCEINVFPVFSRRAGKRPRAAAGSALVRIS